MSMKLMAGAKGIDPLTGGLEPPVIPFHQTPIISL